MVIWYVTTAPRNEYRENEGGVLKAWVSSRSDENGLKLTGAMVAQLYEYATPGVALYPSRG